MASARQAALAAERSRYATRRVSPNSLGSRSRTIQRRVVSTELKSMINSYNQGNVSNEAFLQYLNTVQSNSLLTSSETLDVEKRIGEFQVKVEGERLEAAYKQAADNSDEKVQAAANLSKFYNQVAQSQEPGTIAQSQSLQKAGQWEQTAVAEQTQIASQDRRLLRAEKLFAISQIEPNSIEQVNAQAEAYRQLALEAQNDGDQTEALQFATKANEALSRIPAIQERQTREFESASRTERVNYFRQIQDAYHDGKIGVEEAAQAMNSLNEAALNAGDTALVSSINSYADRLQKDFEKGTQTGDLEGLPWMKRTTAGGSVTSSIKEMKSLFAQEDDVFRAELATISRIPDAQARLEKSVELYASYLYGAAPSAEDPDGWTGLSNRVNLYKQWAETNPKSAASYENAARDVQAKLASLEPKLAQTVAQFESIPGVAGNPQTAEVLRNVMGAISPEFQIPAGQEGNFGVLITTDDYGRQYEKIVPLNSMLAETDPVTGLQTSTSTYIGKDIAKMTDANGNTKYVKLQPHFASPEDAASNFPDFYFAEHNGQLYVKEPYEDALVPAEEAALKNPNIASYVQQKQQEVRDKAAVAYEKYKQSPDFIGPKERPIGPLNPQAEAGEKAVRAKEAAVATVTKPATPQPVPAQDYKAPVEAFKPETVKPQDYMPAPQNIKFTPQAPAPIAPVKIADANFTNFDLQKTQQPQLQLPQQNVLQKTGFKVDLGKQFAPAIGPKPEEKKQGLGTKVVNFFKNLNPFK